MRNSIYHSLASNSSQPPNCRWWSPIYSFQIGANLPAGNSPLSPFSAPASFFHSHSCSQRCFRFHLFTAPASPSSALAFYHTSSTLTCILFSLLHSSTHFHLFSTPFLCFSASMHNLPLRPCYNRKYVYAMQCSYFYPVSAIFSTNWYLNQ